SVNRAPSRCRHRIQGAMKILACALLLTSVVGCGDDGGMTTPADAAPVVPAHIMISGTAQSKGISSAPLAGVAISAYSNTDENTAVATATTDQSGNYTLDVTTNGKALDGYIKASIASYLDTYLYAPAPLAADYAGASMNLVTENTLETLSSLCHHGITNAMGVVGLEVIDKAGAVVAGAMVTGTPAPAAYCYDGTSGLPDSTVMMTNADGLGYMLDLSGSVTVTASKSGMTFGSHVINVRIGSLTTTLVAGQ
ncbi:MAG: hypothetical protein ABI704_30190, partial [Kofleriaceae bacterium]